jgi:hypothetical protein
LGLIVAALTGVAAGMLAERMIPASTERQDQQAKMLERG